MNTYAEGGAREDAGNGMADPRTTEAKLQAEREAECGGARNARRVARKEARRRARPW